MEIKIKESSIYYTITGTGPTLVLLHGFLESSSIWNEITKRLSSNYNILAIDLPGHGKSEVMGEVQSMALMAEVVYEVLQNEAVSDAIMLGHSMGGYVALAFAEKYEGMIRKLILLNSTPEADSEERKLDRNRGIELLNSVPKAYIRMAIGNLFPEQAHAQFASRIEALKVEALSFPVEGISAMIKGMRDRKERKKVLECFKSEKILVCGEKDPLLPITKMQNIANQCNTSLTKLSSGHMSWMDQEDEIVKIVHFID